MPLFPTRYTFGTRVAGTVLDALPLVEAALHRIQVRLQRAIDSLPRSPMEALP